MWTNNEAKDKRRICRSLSYSIKLAVHEYRARHDGAGPALISVTPLVYKALLPYVYYEPTHGQKTIFDIPTVVEPGEGYHIHLSEPEIPLYDIPGPTVQVFTPPDHYVREG